MRKSIVAAICLAALLFAGCSSTFNEVEPIIDTLQLGDYQAAKDKMNESIQKNLLEQQGPIVLGLDVGMLSYYAGEYETSNRALNSAEAGIYSEYTESLAAGAATYLFNDNSKAYPGERYEDIYLNIFKSLNYYHLGSSDSAMVEIRKSIDKIEELKKLYETMSAEIYGSKVNANEKFETEFISSALSLYLGMVYSRGIGDSTYFSYCNRNIAPTYSSQPNIYNFGRPSFLATESYTYSDNKARLNFMVFTGLAPYKVEEAEIVRLNAVTQQKLVYPVLEKRSSSISSIRVSIPSAGIREQLQLVEDFDNVISDIFSVRQKAAYEKAAVRSGVKAGVADFAAHYLENAGDVRTDTSFNASLVFVLQGLATHTESADVRGSHFFPSKAWGNGFTLEEGEYDIKIEYLDRSGKVLKTEQINDYPVYADKANLIDSFCLI